MLNVLMKERKLKGKTTDVSDGRWEGGFFFGGDKIHFEIDLNLKFTKIEITVL